MSPSELVNVDHRLDDDPRDRVAEPPDGLCHVGCIHKIIFQRNGFLAAVLKDGTTVAGEMHAAPAFGRVYRFAGEWQVHPRFGRQFKFKSFDVEVPRGRDAIAAYLKETCSYLGPVRVSKIMQAFGDDALAIAQSDPARVAQAAGISIEKAEIVARELKRLEADQEIEIGLRTLFEGIRIRKSVRAMARDKWGRQVCEVIKAEPFLLTEFPGVGFLTADQVARRVGFPHDSPKRIRAGLLHALEKATNDGHCFLEHSTLLEAASKLLGLAAEPVAAEIDPMQRDGAVTIDAGGIYLPKIHAAERAVAAALSERAQGQADTVGADVTGLSDDQRVALGVVLASRLSLLTGPPGTGKTHTLNRVIKAFPPNRVAVCAPTGKAARRLRELTGWPAVTIHRLLEPKMLGGQFVFTRDQYNPIDQTIVVVDECSMVSITLMASLVAALRPETRLILTGDPDQLPSVGPGAVLRDLMGARVVAHARLTEIHRQVAGSRIIRACHAIREGAAPEAPNQAEDDFFVLQDSDAQRIASTVVDLVYNRLPARYGFDPLADIQVITGHRDKLGGCLSAEALNAALQARRMRGSPADDMDSKRKFFPGDKVMQTVNGFFADKHGGESFVANGDIGIVASDEKGKITVDFDNPERRVTFQAFDNDLDLAYAVTVHKFQGSQAPCIVLPIHRSTSAMLLQRSWLYTAVSRAEKLCVVVGDRAEISKCVARVRQDKRATRLAELLRAKVLA